MPTLHLYNLTSSFVPRSECTHIFGDNSTHSKPNPWPSALRVLHVLGMATDGEDHYRIARHYTIRLAASPADDAAVRRILSEQRCGKDVDVAKYTASSAAMMLACRILVDGGEDDSSVEERLLSVPREQWLPYPVPVEVSAVGKPGPGGGYVLLDDLPKPVLEEYVVSIAGMRNK